MVLIPPALLAQRYLLGEHLTDGGACTVRRAHDQRLDVDVVIKFLGRRVDDAAREVQALSRLRHPNNVRVLDFGVETRGADEVPFVVLESVRGRTLRSVLRHCRRISPQRAVSICLQVLRALGEAHDLGIVHSDVKPENVLVSHECVGDECVKLVDYGACWIRSREALEGERPRPGTPHYVAPEVIRGQTPTPAADIYAVGAVLYESIAGTRPYEASDPKDALKKALREAPRPLSSLVPVSPALERVVTRALTPDPMARYAGTRQMQADLQDIADVDLSGFDLGSFAQAECLSTLATLESVEPPIDVEPVQEADAPEPTIQIRSNERPVLWFLDDDPAIRSGSVTALRGQLEDRCEVEVLDEDDRFIARWEIDIGRRQRPWLVFFGGMHVLVEDPLLQMLGAWPDTAKVLAVSQRNVELVQTAVNWCGLDHLMSLPDDPDALVRRVDGLIERCRRRHQQYDCLRLAFRDAREDRARVGIGEENR
ncbi:MAG: serine/threonine protein kinase [Deltaproteobacteria bacterium]|nr:serine/threonine protein kinase [Deltaproteobacteria bacterium]